MRKKPLPRVEEVNRIKGFSSAELTERCPDQRKAFPRQPCTLLDCAWRVENEAYMNCTFVVAEAGEHSLEEVGAMMGITREGVRLIQIRALGKMRSKGLDPKDLRDGRSDLSEPSLSAGEGLEFAHAQGLELPDESDFLPTFYAGKLD